MFFKYCKLSCVVHWKEKVTLLVLIECLGANRLLSRQFGAV